jgi:hypothetical protein
MKYLVAKLTINLSLLYQELWHAVLSCPSPASDGSQSLVPVPSFDCYMRGLWIDILRSLRIVCSLEDGAEDSTPFTAGMSMMNHSLDHFPTQVQPTALASLFSCQCVCEECWRYKSCNLSIRDEGESLRTHFRALCPQTEPAAERAQEDGLGGTSIDR